MAACTLTCSWLLLTHTEGMNGPSYWKWPWQRLAPSRVYPTLAFAATPLFLALWWFHRRPRRPIVPLVLAMISMFLLQLGGIAVLSEPMSLDKVARFVKSPRITSYFTDANKYSDLETWLANYPQRMAHFRMHSRNKPPGPILFYVPFLGLAVDRDSAAHWGGIAIGLLATLAIPATFVMARALGASVEAAVYGALLFALLPGPLYFFPEFDQVYAPLVAVMIASWLLVLERSSWLAALAFGLCLTVVTLFSYGLLVIGLFLALTTVTFLCSNPTKDFRSVVARSVAALAVPFGFYGLGWTFWSYDPIATFRAALAEQEQLLGRIPRPYPETILFDLTDFALGVGYLGVLLAGYSLLRRSSDTTKRYRWILLLVVIQLVVTAVGAFTPGETARLWIFIMPLVMFGAGTELEKWQPRHRVVAFACALLIASVIRQNLIFLQ